MRRTKIICTIGPASLEKVAELRAAGMDIARINTAYTRKTKLKERVPLMIDVRSVRELERLDIDRKSLVALSFVRNSDFLRSAREVTSCPLVAKIETKDAVFNLKEIVKEADYIMIARGDLGKAFGIEFIPILQAKIIEVCKEYETPFIIATELLKSMVDNEIPTRAEANDVFYAVKNGAFGVLLAEETAIGRHPIKVVSWLRRIIEVSEAFLGPPGFEPGFPAPEAGVLTKLDYGPNISLGKANQ